MIQIKCTQRGSWGNDVQGNCLKGTVLCGSTGGPSKSSARCAGPGEGYTERSSSGSSSVATRTRRERRAKLLVGSGTATPEARPRRRAPPNETAAESPGGQNYRRI